MLRTNGEWVTRRFKDYDQATRFLTGLRFKIQEGSFDARDYQADNPLGFGNLARQWLALKMTQIKRHSWDSLNNTMQKAMALWEHKNIKEVQYAELEDFLTVHLAGLSIKSRSNASSVLHSFFDWLRRRRVLHVSQIPDWPEIGTVEMAYRRTVTREVQTAILDELHRIAPPRVWLAAKFLSTYFSIRPGELIRVKEREIVLDGSDGYFLIPSPKDKRPKAVPILEEDVELLAGLPRSFPELPFFRHFKGIGGAKPGSPFGPRYIYKWWKAACANLGIEDVDLYGGTKHSTVVHLGQFFTPEQLKAASMHSTNKAFERYYRMQPEQIKSVYSGGKQTVNGIDRSRKKNSK